MSNSNTPIKVSDVSLASRPLVAEQIAALLTAHNKLLVAYSAEKILAEEAGYLVLLGPDNLVIGSIQVKKVQWYQAETCHLTVHPAYRRQGFGTALKHAAENEARALGAKIAQCTVREDNIASRELSRGAGWSEVSAFRGDRGNMVRVYQKTL
jgi:ribosomal protein S18 acetylase RimI-like enzyme